MHQLPMPVRFFILFVVLCGVLAGTFNYFVQRLSLKEVELLDYSESLETIKHVNEASRAFGDLKYWITDLAVSQLVRSEINAAGAREDVDIALGYLVSYDAKAVTQLRADIDLLYKQSELAVDAYSNGQRVQGNMFMSKARLYIENIDSSLTKLSDGLHSQYHKLTTAAVNQTTSASQMIKVSFVLAAFIGGIFALLGVVISRQPVISKASN